CFRSSRSSSRSKRRWRSSEESEAAPGVTMGPMRLLLFALPMLALAQNTVKSPDGAIELAFSADGGALAYTVAFHGRPVLTKSTLALEIQDQPALGPNVRIAGARPGAID